MTNSDDTEVQNALNPNPENLDENDPNVARDPVCGVLVDKRTAQDTMAAPINDKGVGTLYFHSADCKALFESNPAQYGYPTL
jgi:YHS domain-containing protein